MGGGSEAKTLANQARIGFLAEERDLSCQTAQQVVMCINRIEVSVEYAHANPSQDFDCRRIHNRDIDDGCSVPAV
jgi:hypothetical protein